MKVYITKYALTLGIEEREAEVSKVSDKMVVFDTRGYEQPVHKPFWHLTKEEAVAHAKELRVKKLASLQKQAAKLEKLTF